MRNILITSLGLLVLMCLSEPISSAETAPVSDVTVVQGEAGALIQTAIVTPSPVASPTPAVNEMIYPEPTHWEPIDAIPLDPDIQRYFYDSCERYGVPVSLALGIAEVESTFRLEAVSELCWGLMQIHSINYGWLRDMGIEPLTYPGNIDAGVLMISQLLSKYEDTHKALMAYNCGEGGARKLLNRGIFTTRYSRAVVQAAEKWAGILSEQGGGGS